LPAYALFFFLNLNKCNANFNGTRVGLDFVFILLLNISQQHLKRQNYQAKNGNCLVVWQLVSWKIINQFVNTFYYILVGKTQQPTELVGIFTSFGMRNM